MDTAALKEQLAERRLVTGIGISVPAPQFVETVGMLGVDFAFIDMEHTSISLETLEVLVLAGRNGGVVPLVRPRSASASTIQRVLDIGASGVVIPKIRSAADVQSTYESTVYEPDGSRGMCSLTRSAAYTTAASPAEYRSRDDALVRMGLIETPEAIDDIDGILDVGVLDAVLLGPGDLANAIGLHGQFQDEQVISLLQRVIDAGQDHEVAVGAYAISSADARSWLDRGADFVFYGDIRLIRNAVEDHVTAVTR